MAKNTDPLRWNSPIVRPDGTPTREFLAKWNQQRRKNGDNSGLSTQDLTDVSDNTPTDGQLLVWDEASKQWTPNAPAKPALHELTDVDLSVPPTDGQLLSYDAASGKWKAVSSSGGGGGNAIAGAMVITNSWSSSSYIWKGNNFTAYKKLTIESIAADVDSFDANQDTYAGAIVQFDVDRVVQQVAVSEYITSPSSNEYVLQFPKFTSPVTISKGTGFCLFCVRGPEGSSNTVCPVVAASYVSLNYPGSVASDGYVRLNAPPVEQETVLPLTKGTPYSIWCQGTYS